MALKKKDKNGDGGGGLTIYSDNERYMHTLAKMISGLTVDDDEIAFESEKSYGADELMIRLRYRLKTCKAFDYTPVLLQAKVLDLKRTKKVSSTGFGKLVVESNGISWCFRNVNT